MSDEHLHALARQVAATLAKPDRKQLRFNEIVEAARALYPTALTAGITELVQSCDKSCADLYVPKKPMWAAYDWMRT